ncbi:MAG: putative lipid II flippase FtsW [Clostridia bacterium]
MKKLNVLSNNKDKRELDYGLLVSIIALLCCGFIMVSSASSYYALNSYGNSNELLFKQLTLGLIGVACMYIISKVDYKIYKKLSYFAFIISIALLVAVLIPNIGQERNGATRWLGIGDLTFQPSEIVKITLVLAISTYLAKNHQKLTTIKGYLVPFAMIFLVVIIMFLQKHMSGTLVMLVAAGSIIFISGIKIKPIYLIVGAIIASCAIALFLVTDGFRLERITSFMNPEEDIKDGNWQAAQSLYAIGSGGVFGRGLGQSRQKYLWLPEAQNDFIFSVLGEELGFVGAAAVLALFMFFIYRGFKIAISCKDMYGCMIAGGITSIFALQILVNIAVVTCSMPVTGMPLPFFSYGGTALFINLCAMGLLLSVSRNCKSE